MATRSRGTVCTLSQTLLVVVLCLTSLPSLAVEPSDAVQAENAFFRGSNLLSRNNISAAIAALEKAAKLAPQNLKYKNVLAVAYNNLGLKLVREGNSTEGVRFLGKAVRLTPEDKDIRFNFINAALQAASLPEEKVHLADKIAFLGQVTEIDPENASGRKMLAALLNNFGVVKGRAGTHDQEVAALEKAAALDPGNPKIKKNLGTAYYNLALAKGKAGADEKEIELLRTALKLAPKDPLIKENLGRALSNSAVIKGKDGDLTGQIAVLKEALQIFPNDSVTKKKPCRCIQQPGGRRKSKYAIRRKNIRPGDLAETGSEESGYRRKS